MSGILQRYTFTPAAEDTDGIADGLTGAGPWDEDDFVADGPTDGLAHKVSLTSSANLSAITITLTGTDADGNEITEDVTGPNATTAESTKYYKTITDVSASATLSTNELDVGWVDEFVTPTEWLNWHSPIGAKFFLDVTGTINLDVQFSIADPAHFAEQGDNKWVEAETGLTAETADSTAVVAADPGWAVWRAQVNSYSSGASFTLYVSQPR